MNQLIQYLQPMNEPNGSGGNDSNDGLSSNHKPKFDRNDESKASSAANRVKIKALEPDSYTNFKVVDLEIRATPKCVLFGIG